MTDGYAIQINTTIQGDLVNIRASDGNDLKEVVEGLAENSEAIFKALGDVKQIALANGVFSSPATTSNAAPASNSGPPGEVPSCPTHGAMKDMRGKRGKNGQPYKNRYYCKTFGCKDSTGQGTWIE